MTKQMKLQYNTLRQQNDNEYYYKYLYKNYDTNATIKYNSLSH